MKALIVTAQQLKRLLFLVTIVIGLMFSLVVSAETFSADQAVELWLSRGLNGRQRPSVVQRIRENNQQRLIKLASPVAQQLVTEAQQAGNSITFEAALDIMMKKLAVEKIIATRESGIASTQAVIQSLEEEIAQLMAITPLSAEEEAALIAEKLLLQEELKAIPRVLRLNKSGRGYHWEYESPEGEARAQEIALQLKTIAEQLNNTQASIQNSISKLEATLANKLSILDSTQTSLLNWNNVLSELSQLIAEMKGEEQPEPPIATIDSLVGNKTFLNSSNDQVVCETSSAIDADGDGQLDDSVAFGVRFSGGKIIFQRRWYIDQPSCKTLGNTSGYNIVDEYTGVYSVIEDVQNNSFTIGFSLTEGTRRPLDSTGEAALERNGGFCNVADWTINQSEPFPTVGFSGGSCDNGDGNAQQGGDSLHEGWTMPTDPIELNITHRTLTGLSPESIDAIFNGVPVGTLLLEI